MCIRDSAYRVITDKIQCAIAPSQTRTYKAVGLCSFESAEDFKLTPTKPQDVLYALIVVSKIIEVCPNSLELFVEKVEHICPSDYDKMKRIILGIGSVAKSIQYSKENARVPWSSSPSTPWSQRKCRKLSACPTDESLPSLSLIHI